MATVYAPIASDALYADYIGVTFNDPDTFAAADPVRVDSRFFLKPIQDEVLNLIALSLSSGAALRVRNQTGSTISKGKQVYISGTLNVDESGDSANQLSSWTIYGATVRNTRAGKLYWRLTGSGGDYTVDLYRDSGGDSTLRVATGTRTGNGVITLTADNSSGITGVVTVAYTADDTDLTANILELNRLLIDLADADDPTKAAQLVMDADLTTATNGTAYAEREVTGIDTSIVTTVGDPLYLSATAGDFTQTAPSGADTIKQRVGHVLVKHATTGSALFYPGRRVIEKFGTSTFQSNSVTDAVFRQSAGVSVVGRSANSTGNVADITAGANDTMLVRQSNALAFVAWSTILFSDAEGDPTDVSLTAAADGTSAFAARRDHRHVLNQAIAPTWSGVHTYQHQKFFINNPANTFKVGFEMSAEVADRTLTFPLMGGARTVPYLERANTWTLKQTITPQSTLQDTLTVQHSDGTNRLRFGVYASSSDYGAIHFGVETPAAGVYGIASRYDATDPDMYFNAFTAGGHRFLTSNTLKAKIDGNANFLLNGATAPGTSGVGNIGLASGTAPGSSPANYAAAWVADAGDTTPSADDARWKFRTEAGTNFASIGNGMITSGSGTNTSGSVHGSTGLGVCMAMGYNHSGDYGLLESVNPGTAYKEIRYGANAHSFYIDGAITSYVTSNKNFVAGGTGSALATNATNGFFYLPSCAGTPTGVPALLPTGALPCVIDSTNNKLYFYSGGAWRDAGP